MIHLEEGVQPPISVHELGAAEEIIRKDPRVQKLAAEIGISPRIPSLSY
jgi:primary-amine oxidase